MSGEKFMADPGIEPGTPASLVTEPRKLISVVLQHSSLIPDELSFSVKFLFLSTIKARKAI
jgi:hypothetical protein